MGYARVAGGLEPCRVCHSAPVQDDVQMLIHLEEEYVLRVENLDKLDVLDVETVYQAAIDIFDRHWILYVMDTMLWEAYRQKNLSDAVVHQTRRIESHEELGDCLQNQFPHRKWLFIQEFQRAYQMLAILCGTHHQYTASPYNKLCVASNPNGTSDTSAAGAANANVA